MYVHVYGAYLSMYAQGTAMGLLRPTQYMMYTLSTDQHATRVLQVE